MDYERPSRISILASRGGHRGSIKLKGNLQYKKKALFKNLVWSAAGVVIGFLVGSGLMNGDAAKTFVSEPISACLKSGGIIVLVVLFSGLAVLLDSRSNIRPIALDEIRGTIQSFISLFFLAIFYTFTEEVVAQHTPLTAATPWKMALSPFCYLVLSIIALALVQYIINCIPKPQEVFK
ncbi:hypothetical protein [Komagataeibacter sp. SM21]|uniref:hypothetical protein n=1 Tax=Komagataeibacter sp. SM21 TaxID=3242899 RepID=UPI0035273BCB